MDRLTKRNGANVWFAQGRPRGFLCPSEICSNVRICQKAKDRTCPYLSLLDKLAAYEDAEEQGTLFPRWISVDERLPNECDGRLLVCLKLSTGELWQSICRYANNLHDVDEYDFPNENRPGFYYYDNEWGEYMEMENVTHWQPLPMPPKEEA